MASVLSLGDGADAGLDLWLLWRCDRPLKTPSSGFCGASVQAAVSWGDRDCIRFAIAL
ncbi:hypothetical protein [Laspinema olomoucense]|uniref:hypothetical protein n=1 Tax=Laspinema olomoucense TaxID=3231600 RepID=UPI0021BB5C98|nr:hypothetical protein [Laspinema sp. D3a]MCT7987049.1 hypothetical protein [Laspinema sp. D3a]